VANVRSAESLFVGSATLVAVTVTFALGTVIGAEYRPFESTAPLVASPVTAQVTLISSAPVTVAVSWAVVQVSTSAFLGLTTTETSCIPLEDDDELDEEDDDVLPVEAGSPQAATSPTPRIPAEIRPIR
jgi:hypothetical protein